MPPSEKLKLFPYAQAAARGDMLVRLSPKQYCLVELVLKRPRTLSELIDAVYGGDANGGPENARNSLSVIATFANVKLKAIGIRVGAESKGQAPLWKISDVARQNA